MTFAGGQGDTEVTGDGQTVNFAPVNRIDPGETLSWVVQAQAQQPGRGRFNLRMSSDATRRPVSETEPTNVF